ncbi:MAG: universal stress protein [Sandaracinaceae bacterium]|nr:universal stress protein [Sandaracinaceae bacterium]
MSTTIRRILCPVDFSEPSRHAFEYALGLAETLGAEVHLAHAYQLPVFALPDGAMMPTAEMAAAVSTDAQRALDAMEAPEGRTVVRHLTEGVPHKEIERLVDELDIDLVVVGTHGRTGIRRLLIGSVAERVVRTCPVPVLTVPPPPQ